MYEQSDHDSYDLPNGTNSQHPHLPERQHSSDLTTGQSVMLERFDPPTSFVMQTGGKGDGQAITVEVSTETLAEWDDLWASGLAALWNESNRSQLCDWLIYREKWRRGYHGTASRALRKLEADLMISPASRKGIELPRTTGNGAVDDLEAARRMKQQMKERMA